MIRIVLAEDHALVREGLRRILEREPSFEIVAEAATGIDAVELTRIHKPTILLLDLTLPRLHGLDAMSQLSKQSHTKILIVSMHSDVPSVLEGLRLGATGFVLKDAPSTDLICAIKMAVAGQLYLGPSLEKLVRQHTHDRLQRGQDCQSSSLSKRERAVLQKVALGLDSQQIAIELGVAVSTVSKHRSSIMQKTGAHTQIDVLRYALRHNLVQL